MDNNMIVTISIVFVMVSAPIIATVASNRKHKRVRQGGLKRYRVGEPTKTKKRVGLKV